MSKSDADCIRLCLDGRPEAYGELVARYQAPLLSYLAGRLGDKGLADEAAHEAFVRSYLALRQLRKPESFFPWLVGIADRVAKEERRHRASHGEIDETVPASSGATPAQRYDLERAVADLPETYRNAVLLRYYGGLSCAEIAGELAVPLATVTKRLSRAYAMLRARLGPNRDANNLEVRK